MHFRSVKRPGAVSRDHWRPSRPYPRPWRGSFLAARQHHRVSDFDPPPWPSHPRPSPHDILGAEKGAPYSKASKTRFCRLVKLYHPDLARGGPGTVSPATRAERYRLVVSANELLSCPNRRRLYEQYGIGWVFPAASSVCPARASWRQTDDDHDDHGGWSPEREQATAAPQVPIFASNATMAMLLVALAFAGAIVQLERARRAHWALRLGDAALQDAISKDLEGVAERLEGRPREIRILEFLARREFGALKDTGDGALLADQGDNVCRH